MTTVAFPCWGWDYDRGCNVDFDAYYPYLTEVTDSLGQDFAVSQLDACYRWQPPRMTTSDGEINPCWDPGRDDDWEERRTQRPTYLDLQQCGPQRS